MNAKYYLGEAYEEGLGVEADLNVAEKWYEEAAAQGCEEAKEKVKVKVLAY